MLACPVRRRDGDIRYDRDKREKIVSWGLLFDPHPSLGSTYVYGASAIEVSQKLKLNSPKRAPSAAGGDKEWEGKGVVCGCVWCVAVGRGASDVGLTL